MKKLLVMLTTITSLSSITPIVLANAPILAKSEINYLQTNNLENLNRNKREIKTDIYFSCSGDGTFTRTRITGTFNPNSWERIIHNYQKNNPYQYDHIFKALIEKHKNRGVQSEYVGEIDDGNCDNMPEILIASPIFNSWNQINDVWQESNRTKRIKIIVASNVFSNNYYLESVDIIDDGAVYQNDYLNNFNNDFNNSRQKRSISNSNDIINLGLIEDNNNSSILNKIKNLYPSIDISHFEIIEKSDYSHINQNFSAKLSVKNNSNRYSAGLQKKIIFNTKTKLDEIKNEILNNNLVKQWIKHINEWKNNLNKLDINRLKKDNNWLITQKEIAKSYIRDLNIILDLMKNDFKIEELNTTVQGIKSDINNLKDRMNKLENRIENLENSPSNSGLAWCQNVSWGVSVVSGASAFTGVGEVISIISGSAAVLCGIIDTLIS